jgi:hypothetical protein
LPTDTKNGILKIKKTAELRPRPIGSRSRPCRYFRHRRRRAGRGASPRPDPCPPSLSCHKRGPPSRDDLRRRRLCLNVKDGGRCSTAVAHLASIAAPPWASVVVTAVTRLTSTVRTEAVTQTETRMEAVTRTEADGGGDGAAEARQTQIQASESWPSPSSRGGSTGTCSRGKGER